MLQIIKQNILIATEPYIGHQTNCYSKSASGLAYSLFDKFSYADTYSNRNSPSVPGSITVHSKEFQPTIINLYAQKYPGQSNITNDTRNNRLSWFQECLNRVKELPNIKQGLALPFNIGCGLAGGIWSDYLKIIEQYSELFNITLYHYD